MPDAINGTEDQLEYLLRPHGIMRRRVVLKKGWHKEAIAPMLATRKDNDKFRNKGYSTKCVEKCMEWYKNNKNKYCYSYINWWIDDRNEASIKIAKKFGFKLDKKSLRSTDHWMRYYYE